MAAYYDVMAAGQAVSGLGEFTLEYGNYKVSITVPMITSSAATGVLQTSSCFDAAHASASSRRRPPEPDLRRYSR